MVLDRIPWRGRQFISPQRIGQFVDAHDAVGAQRQQREQAPTLAPADLRRPSAGHDLEGPEKPDLQRVGHADAGLLTSAVTLARQPSAADRSTAGGVIGRPPVKLGISRSPRWDPTSV